MKLNDLTGKRFGRLTVISRCDHNLNGEPAWNCICDCGKSKVIRGEALKNGATKSCGCISAELSRERMKKIATTHGESRTRLYSVWASMLARCENPNRPQYKNYGSIGISVCPEWHDFKVFSEWAKENGYDENAKYGKCTLERMCGSLGYSPENCKWCNMTGQARNKRTNVFVNYEGKKVQLSSICEKLQLNYPTVVQRLKNGWSEYDALHTPIKERKNNARRNDCCS